MGAGLETRQDSSYTDAIVQSILSRNLNQTATIYATAALEACCRINWPSVQLRLKYPGRLR